MDKPLRVVELFAGIGGFRLGLEQALGKNVEIVYVNEWDKYAAQTYEKNFIDNRGFLPRSSKTVSRDSSDPAGRQARVESVDTRDITQVPASDIPDHDLLVGGFPCQAFSVAGKRRGFEDTRGTLFFEIQRILDAKRPPYLLLENVKGLLNHDSGRTFEIIMRTLDELGYELQWQVLNSKDFGVPQNRERVFIVGNLRGKSRPQVFPIQGGSPEDTEQITSTTIDANYWKGIDNHGQRTAISELKQVGNIDQKGHNSLWGRVYSPSGVSSTLNAHGGGMGAKTGLYAIPVLTPDRIVKRQNGRRFKTDGEPMFTLNTQDKHGIYDGVEIRRLTPTECERLQGFPDGWTEGVSDTQRYRQLGNAVSVPVVYEIAKRAFSY